MKALTLWQPFASLIIDGSKTSEFRTWRPPAHLIDQRIVIHAGKATAKPLRIRALIRICENDPVEARLMAGIEQPERALEVLRADSWPSGVLLGSVRLHGVHKLDRGGMWRWSIVEPQPLPPIPARGYQGLWNIDLPGQHE